MDDVGQDEAIVEAHEQEVSSEPDATGPFYEI